MLGLRIIVRNRAAQQPAAAFSAFSTSATVATATDSSTVAPSKDTEASSMLPVTAVKLISRQHVEDKLYTANTYPPPYRDEDSVVLHEVMHSNQFRNHIVLVFALIDSVSARFMPAML
jgi:hypothetical protein